MAGSSLDPCILLPFSQAAALPQDYECDASPGEGTQALAFPRTHAPASVTCAGDRDQLSDQCLQDQVSDQHLQAKRARVESIIQGMSLPLTTPAFGTSLEATSGHERQRGSEMPWESKRKLKVPQQGTGAAGQVALTGGSPHAEGCQQLKEQLCFLEQQLRRLQEKFSQIQEALTPGHLKKAKLMFFFTRYPSSALLKTYFLDVQFSRCVTSQLIKWFSNFREFYYIQVEKSARQALLEGVADTSALRVSRDSELFRALNTHYNKGNDFEVPGQFLEVASLTLREFFSAIRAGKDADPSWKKPIYKIISKLDSDIPEVFKATGCSQELLRS
ncbi:prospero homeobox protein 2 [Patagioenas fasciata monilis]|uniref:Prospero homeobox protein 2 n=1 Tax=Patagioenas fasciata monilis TaxID=372326 RepID=A0A1V4KFM1_PATFA|nr:prospero homeobox protein 2 [Patagioenas fasciata monilis]